MDDDLNKKQLELQREANKFLADINLMDSLSKFGTPVIAGSLAAGLMTWPDIDIEVYSEKLVTREDLADFAKEMFRFPGNERIVLLDNREGYYPYYSYGLYVMLQQKRWKVDIWFFLNGQKNTGKDYLEDILKKLNPENRKVILEIKAAISDNPRYRKDIFSVDIYNAVLDEGVRDLEQFKVYLRKSGRSLEN